MFDCGLSIGFHRLLDVVFLVSEDSAWFQSQNTLQEGQTLSQTFCGWIGVLIPLLEAMPTYKSCQVQARFLALLGDFARVTIIDSMEF